MLFQILRVLAITLRIVTATYAPTISDCPAGVQLVRQPRGLSKHEADWVRNRKSVAADAFAAYLDRVQLEDFDLATYKSKLQGCPRVNMPTIGMANSGGGFRSAFTGVGGLRAFDENFAEATEQKTGGLLQSMTYYAGLSGGSWPVSSLALNDYPAVDDLVALWKVNVSRLGAESDSEDAATYQTMFEQIAPKFKAGFNISVMDLLGRAFAYEFIPGPSGALETTWSSITQLNNFKNFSGPMPILQAESIDRTSPMFYGIYIASGNGTIYEWTPFEFGSWNAAFTPTQYVGSKLDANGSATECVEGLDRASFVLGTVASAYNAWYLSELSNGTLGHFSKRDSKTHRLARRDSPFPFKEFIELDDAFNQTFNLSVSQILSPSLPVAFSENNITLADNSEALQSLPFWSLIQPERNVDFIVAWDDDGDSTPYRWNNGTNMYNTYVLAKQARLPFPAAPPPSTFLARNYTSRPTFFGCNTSLTTTGDSQSPMVLYLTNAPYSWYSNFTWGDPAMSFEEFDGVLINSFNFVTQANGTLDSEWPACIACAAIERSLERVGMQRSDQCERCFEKYCWDGTEETIEGQVFDPSLVLDPGYGFIEWNKTHPFSN